MVIEKGELLFAELFHFLFSLDDELNVANLFKIMYISMMSMFQTHLKQETPSFSSCVLSTTTVHFLWYELLVHEGDGLAIFVP